MIALLRLFLAIVASLFKSKARLEAENTTLRQQLIVLRRKLPGRIKLTNGDRTFFVWLYRLFPSVRPAFVLVQPETLVRWHRAGFRRYWRGERLMREITAMPQQDVREHAAIVQAIAGRRREQAVKAVTTHLRSFAALVSLELTRHAA